MSSTAANIRHPELSKMNDKALQAEFDYSLQQCHNASINIACRVSDIVNRSPLSGPPLWKLHEDHQIHTDRLQAIAEELEYRKLP